MGVEGQPSVADQPSEQPKQPEQRTKSENLNCLKQQGLEKKMGSRAVQQFHRRNPSQHRVLSSIIDDMNKETRMKNLKMHKYGGRITNVPIDVEPMDVENVEDIRAGRPEKKVTWSRKLESVRSISPRQKTPRTPRMASESPRTSRMSEAVNTLRGGQPLTQEGAGVKDCGHFLCQRVGGVCLQGEEQQGNLRPGYQNLPCSPQMQTVVWRSIPISRASNNNNNKRAGLSLDLGNAFLQGEGLV